MAESPAGHLADLITNNSSAVRQLFSSNFKTAAGKRRGFVLKSASPTTTQEAVKHSVESFADDYYSEDIANQSASMWDAEYSDVGAAATIFAICVVIVIIVFGNTLTICAVVKERRLRQAQNWFIVSLAVADLLVGLTIMPLTLAYEVLGKWVLGSVICEVWLALDVLFVTSSILNLCVISVDRYWSVTDPINYVQKRTPKRVLAMIAMAWIVAVIISFPPLVGWRKERERDTDCLVSDQLDYVLYSAMGSFYIPSLILIGAYAKIFQVTRIRAKKLAQGCATRPGIIVPDGETIIAQGGSPKRSSGDESPMSDPISADYEQAFRVKVHQSNGFAGQKHNQVCASPTLNGTRSNASSATVETCLIKSRSETTLETQRSWFRTPSTGNVSGNKDNSQPAPPSTDEKSPSLIKYVAQLTRANTTVSSTQPVTKASVSRRTLIRRREIRATAILGCILFAFILSWLPFFLLYLFGAIGYKASPTVFDVFFWLGYCNSAANPIIYAVVNVEFRRAFQKLLCPSKHKRIRV